MLAETCEQLYEAKRMVNRHGSPRQKLSITVSAINLDVRTLRTIYKKTDYCEQRKAQMPG